MDLSNPVQTVVPTLDGAVLAVLARTTRHLTGRQVSALARTGSISGVRLTLNRLEEQGLVLTESAGRATLYRANRDHLLWDAVEILMRASDSALRELQNRVIGIFASEFAPAELTETTIALFGSVARGTSTAHSDIDLVVVFPDSLEESVAQHAIDLVTKRVFDWTGNQCNIYGATDERLAQLLADGDVMITSWQRDAQTFHGKDINERIISAGEAHAKMTHG